MTDDYTPSAISGMVVEFFQRFKRENEYTYIKDIDSMRAENKRYVEVDYNDLGEIDVGQKLATLFFKTPDLILEAFSRGIKETLQKGDPDYANAISEDITARIINYPNKKSVREINSSASGKFLAIKAIVIRMSPVDTIPLEAVFVCPDNHYTTVRASRNFSITEPAVCSNQGCKHRGADLEIVGDRSKFIDYQIINLQELPNELPAGKLPKTLGVFVAGDLVDNTRMGDTVEISGVVRPEQGNKIKLVKEVQTYRQRLYANSIKTISAENDFGGEITKKEIDTIESIKGMEQEKASKMLIRSFAPHIYGHDLIKEALILTMVGSNAMTLNNGTKIRGDINVFLVGDPGTAKSEMGMATYRIAPRAFYASGRGSSGAGLTAATIQDKTTGAYMLEPGITVLADEGLSVIDEFDKMKPEDRSALHEVMEQQSASISKGGITATLNARTSIIGIANPIYGKYDSYKNLTENIPSIPIPLLTRFDLIFIIKDFPDSKKDEKIARHIISTHRDENITPQGTHFKSEIFAKYLRVAKEYKPTLSNEAEDKIVSYYLKMRNDDEDRYIITPRQLEGLIRLSVARAKSLLKDVVDVDDANRAIYIMEEMYKSSGIDVNTGKIDPGVYSGKPKSEISKIVLFRQIMKDLTVELVEAGESGVSADVVKEEMVKSGKWDEDTAAETFKKALRDGLIYTPTTNQYRLVSDDGFDF